MRADAFLGSSEESNAGLIAGVFFGLCCAAVCVAAIVFLVMRGKALDDETSGMTVANQFYGQQRGGTMNGGTMNGGTPYASMPGGSMNGSLHGSMGGGGATYASGSYNGGSLNGKPCAAAIAHAHTAPGSHSYGAYDSNSPPWGGVDNSTMYSARDETMMLARPGRPGALAGSVAANVSVWCAGARGPLTNRARARLSPFLAACWLRARHRVGRRLVRRLEAVAVPRLPQDLCRALGPGSPPADAARREPRPAAVLVRARPAADDQRRCWMGRRGLLKNERAASLFVAKRRVSFQRAAFPLFSSLLVAIAQTFVATLEINQVCVRETNQ